MSGNYISKIPILVVALVIGIVLVTSAVVPLASDYSDDKTFTNDTGILWRMKALENGDTYTYTGATDTWTLNGVDQGIESNGQNALLGPNWCVRANGQARGETISGNLYNTILAVTSEDTITFTAQGLGGNATQNLPGYGVDKDGDYALTIFGQMAAYCNGDSKIVGTGNTAVDNVGMIVHVEATVDDGATFTIMDNRGGSHITDIVLTNTQVNYTKVAGYVDLYKVTSITTDISFNATDSEETTTAHTGTITYSSVVVPYEVTASTDNPAAYKNLVKVVPLMAFIMLVVAAAGMIYFKNRD